MDGYERLSNAIIEQAAKDYIRWRKDLYHFSKGKQYHKHGSSTTTAERIEKLNIEVEKIRKFFRGQWFVELNSMDGEYILNRLDDEFEKWVREQNLKREALGP